MQGGHKVGEQKFPEFSRFFHSNNYTFPEVITTKILAIWQHLRLFLAIFSPRMRRNGYYSWHLLGRVPTPWDHNDPAYPVNSCFMQIFDCTKIILFAIIFPWGCTEFPENSMSFLGSENSLSIPGFFMFVATLSCTHARGGHLEHMLWHTSLFTRFIRTFYETVNVIWYM